MLRMNWKTAAFTIAGLGLMTPAQGDQVTDMQVQIDQLRSELSQVKTEQDGLVLRKGGLILNFEF